MTTPVWSGVTIDYTLLSGYGYNETITVNSDPYIRFLGYMAAGIAECGNQVTAAAGGLVGSSSSSVAIGAGSKTFTADVGKAWTAGMIVSASADATNYLIGTVTSYDSASGTLILNALDVVGAGTFTSWTICLSARRGSTGAQGIPGIAGADGATGATGSGSTINAAQDGSIVTVAPRSKANFQNSIVVADDAGNDRFDVKLSGDTATPGNTEYYGTNGSGVKGWYGLAAVVAAAVPFATDADALAKTSSAEALVPSNIPSIISGNICKFTRITGSTTFVKDPRSVFIEFTGIGGGQAGAAGSVVGLTTPGGIGGRGGEIQIQTFAAADVSSSLPITIGAGGVGSSSTTGASGGDTAIGNLMIVRGGSGSLPNASGIGAGARAGSGGSGGDATGSSGAAGLFLGDFSLGISGADGTPGAGNAGSSGGAVTGAAATPSVTRRAGGPGGGGARNNGAGSAVGGRGGDAASAGGGGGGGGSPYAPTGGTTVGNGGNGAAGEVWVKEFFGA